jgi:DNA-binding IclR family transcriptional regulator
VKTFSTKIKRMGNPAVLPAQPNLSLIEGLACLDTLVSGARPHGSRELARLLRLEQTRVNRLLGTLAYLGLAERTPNRKYLPGPGIHVLAALSLRSSPLLAAAMRRLPPLMDRLKDREIAVGVLWRSYVCYIFFGAAGRSFAESIGTHPPYKAEQSSIGRVLLAQLPPKTVQVMFCSRLQNGLTPLQMNELLRDLARVRKQKYAVVNNAGNVTVGVAIGQPPAAGLAAAGKISASQIPVIVKLLHKYSSLISADLAAAAGHC